MLKRGSFGRLLMGACGVLLGVTLAATFSSTHPTADPSTQPATGISAKQVHVPSAGLRVVASDAVEVPKYSVYQDIHPQWCEHTAASITTTLVNDTCFITIELSPQAYTAIRFHSDGDLVMYKPKATTTEGIVKVTFSVTTGITKFWLDVNDRRSRLYTPERSNLQLNCEPGHIGEVTIRPFMAMIVSTGGCLAGQPAAFAV